MRRFFEWVHALRYRVATKLALTFTLGGLIAIALVVTALSFHERRAVTRAAFSDLQSQGDMLAPILGDVLLRDGEGKASDILRVANTANASANVTVTLLDGTGKAGLGDERQEMLVGDRASVAVPIQTHDGGVGRYVLLLEKRVPSIGSAIVEAIEAFFVAGIPLGLFAMSSAYALGEWIIGAPLRRVAERAKRIGDGDLDDSLEVRGSVEVEALKRAINAMVLALRSARDKAVEEEARRLAAVESLRHADRLKTVGTLAAGIAHELGTPLNVIFLEARSIARAVSSATSCAAPSRVEDGCNVIRAQATRMTTIIRQLLDFARRKTPTGRTLIDAVDLVATSARLVDALARIRECTIEIEPAMTKPMLLSVDPGGVQQILTNLFVNAFDAMKDGGGGGRVSVRVFRTSHPSSNEDTFGIDKPWVCIEVEDEGMGMDEATRARVFEPFFTTKDVGSGTGLGLSVALGIAHDHGGFINVRTRRTGENRAAASAAGAARTASGSVFAVYLPAAGADADVDDSSEGVITSRDGRSGYTLSSNNNNA